MRIASASQEVRRRDETHLWGVKFHPIATHVVLTVPLSLSTMPEPLMLILRGEQGVVMGFTWACACRSISTFLSETDEKVFLCQLEDVKGET